MTRYLAIVPARNEAEVIARTVAEIREAAADFDIVVIDDGSTDTTAVRAEAAGANVMRMPFNLGIGAAVQAGYLYAQANRYDIAVQVDGDGQHDPRYIHELLGYLRAHPGVNMVTGSRFLERGTGGFRSSASRRAGIGIFARIVSRVTGQLVTDPTSGFRMTDRLAIELFAREYPPDYPEVEAILLVHAHRLRSAEIAVRMRPRTTGESSISTTQPVYYMVKVLVAIFIGLLRRKPLLVPSEPPTIGAEQVAR